MKWYKKSSRKLRCEATTELHNWTTRARLIQAKTWLLSWVIILNSLFKIRKNFLILKRRKRKDCLNILDLGFRF